MTMRNPAEELAATCLKAGVSIREMCRYVGWSNANFHQWRHDTPPSAGNVALIGVLTKAIRTAIDSGYLPVTGHIERHRRMKTKLRMEEAFNQAGIGGANTQPSME